jgi:hypothetical protein
MCKYLYSEKYRIHTIDSEYKCCFYIGLALILEKIFTLLKTSICCTRLKALIMKSGIGTCVNWCLTRFMKKNKIKDWNLLLKTKTNYCTYQNT